LMRVVRGVLVVIPAGSSQGCYRVIDVLSITTRVLV
jgi:hypothetical protein